MKDVEVEVEGGGGGGEGGKAILRIVTSSEKVLATPRFIISSSSFARVCYKTSVRLSAPSVFARSVGSRDAPVSQRSGFESRQA